jgi:1-hydroxycarotenoid 3,4-desaturase
VVIGAGVGGLVAALELATAGFDVTVVERAAVPGGKLREMAVGGANVDSGPTVFTMRRVFEEIFAAAGASLSDHLTLRPAETLARHAWTAEQRLDLFADVERTAEAIGSFAGAAEARRYGSFCDTARRIYTTLDEPYIRAEASGPLGLMRAVGLRGLADLWNIRPYASMWRALGDHFHDPRLRQLFGRYATYCGSSPFLAPATLMLLAHVERDGVWLVDGGMQRIAVALAGLAASHGAKFRYGTEVAEVMLEGGRATGVRLADGECLHADAVVVNADVAALAGGHLGSAASRAVAPQPAKRRSLSALTWTMLADAEDFPLLRHNVFFSGAYAAEFKDILQRARLPSSPTVYVCAQDRGGLDSATPRGAERLLCIVNAPANGDSRPFTSSEIKQCEASTFAQLARCGLNLKQTAESTRVTSPARFNQLFPGTGGALYGRASHGWRASFQRPGSRSRIAGLYLAGGSTHPGPGVPMAALSGRLAAAALTADRASTGRSRTVAMPGGTSTR